MSELFVEIRCEELPPSMVRPALEGLKTGLLALIEGVEHGDVQVYATPRRLAVAIADVAPAKPQIDKTVTGPPAERAFGPDGKPTQAGIGFAKGKGVDPSALQVVDTPKGKVVAVVVREGGEKTVDLVAKGMDAVVRGIPFHKSMQWAKGGLRFGRPIAGISVLYDEAPVPGDVAGYPFVAETVGHRQAPDTAFSFRSSRDWLEGLRARWVEPDLDVRKRKIEAILAEAAKELGAEPIVDAALVEQVLHLVEAPTKLVCEFEQRTLDLPPRLLVESMKVHQRVFPVFVGGKLTNKFVVISNNPGGDPALMAEGNAKVLRPRFHDARFFFTEDKKKRLEAHGEGLVRMRWIKGLGTMAQKQTRGALIAGELAAAVGADRGVVARAGDLTKADLLTQMVNEFPELQGHMGRLYAAAQGEPEAVAVAIEEHYLPRSAEDDVAKTSAGIALALGDRLDTLVGCFGVGMIPKGGGDPQGLRRAALGVVNTLVRREITASLDDLFRAAVRVFHDAVRADPDGYQAWVKERGTGDVPKDADGLVAALVEFTLARFKAMAVAEGASADVVDAVLVGRESRPLVLARKVAAMKALAGSSDFLPILQTFKRVLNISAKAEGNPADRAWTEPSEKGLDQALDGVVGKVDAAVAAADYERALGVMLTLKDPVARFFDEVLVDDPDAAKKARRMGLLQRISKMFLQVADFSRITTR